MKNNIEIKKRLDGVANILIKNNTVPIFENYKFSKKMIYYILLKRYNKSNKISNEKE